MNWVLQGKAHWFMIVVRGIHCSSLLNGSVRILIGCQRYFIIKSLYIVEVTAVVSRQILIGGVVVLVRSGLESLALLK